MAEITPYIERLQAIGPVVWSEGAYGWIGEDGKPVTLEPWQRAALTAYWNNRATCTTLALSNVKKTGKTFLNGVILAWRWLALPGQHFAIGNDLDQAAARQFAMIAEMVKRNSYLSQVCKVGKNELVFEPTGSRLTALAVDAAGNAGANHLTASHTEAWGIIYEAGVRAFEELTPPPGRSYGLPALRVIDSYAGYEGESKTWHSIVDTGLQGNLISKEWDIFQAGGLVLFHMTGEEARARCFRGSEAEAEAYYNDQRQILRPNAFTRMHSNERTAAESQFLPEGAWEACFSRELRPFVIGDGRRLVLGVDASTSRDFTALVGVEYNRAENVTDIAHVRVWKPERGILRRGKPTVDLEETLGAEVLRLHKAGAVDAVIADPYQLHSLIIEWEKEGIRVIELPQTTGRVEADQNLYDQVLARTVRHYNDRVLNEHVKNAVAIETPRGFRLAKEKTSRKIDGAVALSMALHGASETQQRHGGYLSVTADPFADWPPPDDAEYHPKLGWVVGWSHKPHAEGVTWRNCRRSSSGCWACQHELEAEGYFDRPENTREFWENAGGAPDKPERESFTEDRSRENRLIDRFWNLANKRNQ